MAPWIRTWGVPVLSVALMAATALQWRQPARGEIASAIVWALFGCVVFLDIIFLIRRDRRGRRLLCYAVLLGVVVDLGVVLGAPAGAAHLGLTSMLSFAMFAYSSLLSREGAARGPR